MDNDAPGPRQPRWLRWPWLCVAVPLAIFADGLLGRTSYAPGDGYLLFIPWFTDAARAWMTGHLPTWNPWAQAGMPLLGTSQSGSMYPPNLVFVLLAHSPILADNLTIVITFLIAGVGAWLLARLLTDDPVAAAVGGLGFGLCTFLFAHVGHQSMDAGAAWLPWMVYSYELLRRRPSALRLSGGGAVIGLALLSGHSQILFMDLAFLAVYVAGTVWLGRPDRPVSSGALAAGMVALGLAFAAVQLVPTIYVVHDSVRSALTYADISAFALPKSQTPSLLFPFLFGDPGFRGGLYTFAYGGLWNPTELSGYPGMAILVLAAVAVTQLWRDRRVRALVLVGAVGLVLAYGPSTPLGRVVYHLPVYGQFRAWGRYVLGLDFAAPMLAACGVARLRRASSRQRLACLAAAAGTTAFVLLAAVVTPRLHQVRSHIPDGTPNGNALLVPCLAAVAGLVCVGLLLTRLRISAPLVIAVVALDLLVGFGWYYQWRQPDYTNAQLSALFNPAKPFAWGPVTSTPGGIDRFLFIGANVAPLVPDWVQVTDMKKVQAVNSNNALLSSDFAAATGLNTYGSVLLTADLWRPTSWVLDLLRTSTVIVDPATAAGGPPAGSLLANGQPVMGSLVRYDYVPRLPQAFLVGGVQHDSFDQALDALHGVNPFDATATAIVDQPCPACTGGPPGPAGTVTRVRWGIDSVSLAVHAQRPGMLVLSQAYSPGWQASVDGRAAPVVRADGLVQGIPVPAGARSVSLSYHAPGLRLGFAVTLVALAMALGAAGVLRAGGRRGTAGGSGHRRRAEDPPPP